MADPYQYVNSQGVIVPDTSDILTGVQAEYQATLGNDLVLAPSTPQGVLMAAEALARAEVVQNNAAVANQINPNIASGDFLDAIMALLGIQRIAATRTLVQGVVLSGVAGTTVPAGTQAQTALGDIFDLLNTVVIGSGGTVTADFVSDEFGPIPCAANTLTQVVTNVLGWETITNPNAGVLGQNTQSDQAARAYRNNVLAFQAVSLVEAITSALSNVSGVQSLAFLENTAATTQTIQTISMVAHSVWACVNGGADVDVAAALLENKSSGAAWNGGTSVAIVEPASGQTYTVKFDRPTVIPILVKVTTPNGDSTAVTQAVVDYVNGNIEGLMGYVVGSDVSPFEIAGAIVTEIPGIFLTKVEISLTGSISYSTATIPIAINQIAATVASNVTVVTS